MKHIFIINPTAGKYDSRQRIYEMADHLRSAHGLDVQCILTQKQGHATEIVQKLCQTGEPLRFYACGGDGTLNEVVRQLYGEHTVTRFRPHHFPFTEPSCEMDVQCHKCGGKGCPTCKGEGWIEVLGAGMIHPKVLEGCGIDTDVYSGWAFGMGLERLAMRRFKISDLRLIFENDVRFLQQF